MASKQLITMAVSHDILFEIFSWLPAKAIYRFRSTDKLLLKFPEETYFALKQSQSALLRDDTCFFIQPDVKQRYYRQIELHSLPGEELSSGVSNGVLEFLSNTAKILASSNGLILCSATSTNQVELFITNPATQSWLPIPIPKFQQESIDLECNLNIGLECDSGDCMVFLFHENPVEWYSNMDCSVYLFKEGAWKTRKKCFFIGGRSLRFDMPVHYNGAVHFISDCSRYLNRNSIYFWPYIMSYNFKSGKSRMLRLPREARKGSHDYSCDMRIFKWGKVANSNQSICLVRLRKHVFTVWVLTKYESSLWRRILRIRVKAMGLMENDPIVTSFTVLNGELLVIATEKKNVYGYGLTNEKYMEIEKICEHGCGSNNICFTSYSNTLRTWYRR